MKGKETQTNGDLAIAWIDLSFSGTSLLGRKLKPILKKMSGFINFGTLNALMGPSGAGKSTLLKCINGKNNSGLSEETQIYLSKTHKIIPCFIVQDVKEHLLMNITGRESLLYASKLKNSGLKEKVNHNRNVDKLMFDLMINDTSNTIVGNCSGGEQKRLAIATELTAIKKPNLLCIDEPTSGLDSNAAEIVIKCLRDTSRRHEIAIVTSIHQPNNDVLLMFDKLYVMGKGGICVYFGGPQTLGQYLKDNGIEFKEIQIPIEVLLKISSKGIDNEQVIYLRNNNFQEYKDLIKEKCELEAYLSPNGIQFNSKSFSFKHFAYLMLRMIMSSYRYEWMVYCAQMVFIVGMGVILAKLYNNDIGKPDGCIGYSANVDTNFSCIKSPEILHEESLLRQNLKYHFFESILLSFLTVALTTLTFSSEVKIFMNEHLNGWYSTGSYYWAKTIVELPLYVLICIAYVGFGYTVSGQIADYYRIFGYIYMLTLGILCSQGLGFLFGILTEKNPQLAVVSSIGAYLVIMFFSGFWIPVEEMPKPFQWISNASYLRQLFENVLILIYGLDRCPSGTLSSILYQFDLYKDEHFIILKNVILITFHMIFVRVLTLFILILKSNPFNSLFSRSQKNESNTNIVNPFYDNNSVSVITLE